MTRRSNANASPCASPSLKSEGISVSSTLTNSSKGACPGRSGVTIGTALNAFDALIIVRSALTCLVEIGPGASSALAGIGLLSNGIRQDSPPAREGAAAARPRGGRSAPGAIIVFLRAPESGGCLRRGGLRQNG
eukprot:CAMPEP_0198494052 /NCGR_PEP_ID=MMETSP1462-20131121/4413_1 /TAXON_ID=1333877 /ORGANISM="Brandtodinium nutriculum, Strain RCC3387" /LENGTH=133 /DNA_ID=CAMNT_0044222777 /DNA_START=51 /DNA_END=448 /DNA_ORIENTATION=-